MTLKQIVKVVACICLGLAVFQFYWNVNVPLGILLWNAAEFIREN